MSVIVVHLAAREHRDLRVDREAETRVRGAQRAIHIARPIARGRR